MTSEMGCADDCESLVEFLLLSQTPAVLWQLRWCGVLAQSSLARISPETLSAVEPNSTCNADVSGRIQATRRAGDDAEYSAMVSGSPAVYGIGNGRWKVRSRKRRRGRRSEWLDAVKKLCG